MVATVIVEAIKGLKVSFQAEGLEYALKVGHRLALPRPLADRLISAAPDRVRLVEPILSAGCRIAWESPLFGHLEAVALTLTEMTVSVQHPLTKQIAVLPRTWVRLIEEPV